MGGKCLSVGDAEETRAHPRPKRHGGQHGPLVCMQGARARIAHLCQIGSGPLSVLPDVFRPSAVTTYNISPLSYRDSPPLTTLPPSSSTHRAMCWRASRGRGRAYTGQSQIGDFSRGRAGYPSLS